MADKLVLVTCATGKQGGATLRHLAKHGGFKLRAMTRKPDGDAAKALAALGAEVVAGDLDDASSLDRALAGAWGVYSVQNTWEGGVEKEEEQGKRLAKLAREKGLQRFVYASVGSAHKKTGIPHFDNKLRVEETVKALGVPVLRHHPTRLLHGEPALAVGPETRQSRWSSARSRPPSSR